jgi:predicted restriction endonuclease
VKNTAECTGLSERTVKRVTKECRENDENLPSPPKKPTIRPEIEVDEFFQSVIRRKVHSFYLHKVYLTAINVLQEIRNEHDDIPEM